MLSQNIFFTGNLNKNLLSFSELSLFSAASAKWRNLKPSRLAWHNKKQKENYCVSLLSLPDWLIVRNNSNPILELLLRI